VASNITTDRINDIDVHAIVEHCHAHADESLPQGVLAAATSKLLDLVASCSTVAVSTLMPILRRFVWASCGGVQMAEDLTYSGRARRPMNWLKVLIWPPLGTEVN
jgi:hypothetical protein